MVVYEGEYTAMVQRFLLRNARAEDAQDVCHTQGPSPAPGEYRRLRGKGILEHGAGQAYDGGMYGLGQGAWRGSDGNADGFHQSTGLAAILVSGLSDRRPSE